MWQLAQTANTDWLNWEKITPVNTQARKIKACKDPAYADASTTAYDSTVDELTVANAYAAIKTQIAEKENEIVAAEAAQQLTDPLEWVRQNNLYDTYWANWENPGTSTNIASAFATKTVSGSELQANTWKVRGLQSLNLNAPSMPLGASTLPTVKTARDDQIIYNAASSAPGNAVANWLDFSQDLYRPAIDGFYGASKERGIGPVALTTCVDVAGNLAGMQVFFGQYMHKAGAAHGDLRGTCTKTALAAPIQCIEFYYNTPVGTTTQSLVGVNATMWPDRDGADGQTSITAGKVGTVDDSVFKYCWPLEKSGFEFFGFKSTTDTTTTVNIDLTETKTITISTLDIVEYSPVALYQYLW